MGSRFARPDTCTLTLANGDTLIVLRRLNSLQGRTMRARKAIPSLEEPAVVMAYLVDWSLPEMPIAGKSAEVLGSALDNLTDDDFDEIYAAVAAHVEEMDAERTAEKNGRGGAIKSGAISPLSSVPDSRLSTSETWTSTSTRN